jgi:hypothetical protein
MKACPHTVLRRFSLGLLASCFLLGGLPAFAGVPRSDNPPPRKPVKAVQKTASRKQSVRKILVTGSLLPQKLDGVQVTAAPLRVIDRKMIESSGATSVAMLLRTHVSR